MKTAISRTDALEKIRELEQEAVNLETSFNEQMDAIMSKIAEAASGNMKNDVTTAEKTPARRGRPPASASKTKPAKHAKNSKSDDDKVAPSERNYNNTMSLKRAIWDVLDRGPKEWSKLLEDFPEDAEGLCLHEIKEIINAEKKWTSSSADISTQLSSHLSGLKNEDLIARGDGGRYYIVEGAELVSGKRGRKAAA
jgi:hypothetical protein